MSNPIRNPKLFFRTWTMNAAVVFVMFAATFAFIETLIFFNQVSQLHAIDSRRVDITFPMNDDVSPILEIYPVTDTVKHPRIAIISSFLVGDQSSNTRVKDLDHLINKACYAKLWGYDFIFNMTYGFDKEIDEEMGGAYWLKYGTWHRVPHVRDRINDYDWILYADTDYVFNDMKTPIEAFFKNWEVHGLNPSVFIPKDAANGLYTFSAFVVLIKNDRFGRTVLDHWMDFGRGICPNGNLVAEQRKYTWEDSDQPGIWYALTRAHRDLYPHRNITSTPICDNTTGLINTTRAFGPEMNAYFNEVGAVMGSDGSDLLHVPIDQPIIWSIPNEESLSGIGIQYKWGRDEKYFTDFSRYIYGLHSADVNKWPIQSKVSLDLCKRVHGCYAKYDSNGTLHIGCDDVQYTVAQ